MLKQILIVSVVFASIPLVIRLLIKLHLFPLLVYGILVETFLAEWAAAHPIINTGIFAVIALLILFSWLQPVFQRIRERRVAQYLLSDCIHQAHKQGLSSDQYHINMKDGIPILEYEQ